MKEPAARLRNLAPDLKSCRRLRGPGPGKGPVLCHGTWPHNQQWPAESEQHKCRVCSGRAGQEAACTPWPASLGLTQSSAAKLGSTSFWLGVNNPLMHTA